MKKLPVGVIVTLENILEKGIEEMEKLGLGYCQLNCWVTENLTLENAEKVKTLFKEKVKITSLWIGWPGPAVWDFIDGPLTLGLVPKEFRNARLNCLKKGADFAKMLGVKDIITHVGFIPENPSTTEYRELVVAVKEIGQYCKQLGQRFNFETGQETPITLMRTIQDTGLDNLGVNLDPANLLLYGKANPVDAVGIYRGLINGVHVKDGEYPTNGRELGHEKPVGEGMVNFPRLIPELLKYGFQGALIIEREICGPQQVTDILNARKLIESILSGMQEGY